MGVHALWDVVGPTAKPVRLESLSDKRLAVDASIWIYQFLKAVRDKEGNAMRYSHVVGFFRRICKLLYFGIKPVFVFDGGAPVLKRRTIQQRKERRQGRRDNAASTARKLLALQLQNRNSRSETNAPAASKVSPSPSATAASSSEPYLFKPNDEYHLPQIPGFKYDKDDARVNTEDADFKTVLENMDELDGIDLDSINPASKEFDELPKSTQYMILSALRLKSRLRMGYSKEQLEKIFPDSMDFSKFQIDMVKRRNFFTQKLMNITNMHDGGASKLDQEVIRRVEGQRGKQYQLIRTDNGWALSLEGNDGSDPNKAILLDGHNGQNSSPRTHDDDDDEDEDVEWEEVEMTHDTNEKPTDYSIKASLLPHLGEATQAGGGQSFLDKRYDTSIPEAHQRKVTYVRDTELLDDGNDDSDDLLEYDREISIMENLQKSRAANARQTFIAESRPHVGIDVKNTAKITEELVPTDQVESSHTSESTSMEKGSPGIQVERANTDKPISVNQPSTAEQPYLALPPQQSALQNLPANSEDVESPPAEMNNHSPISYKTTGLVTTHNPKDSIPAEEVTFPTESEQNLQHIVSKIPDFNFSGESLLFNRQAQPQEESSSTKNTGNDTQHQQHTPEWFKTTSISASAPNYNPYNVSSFITDATDDKRESARTKDETLGLISGSMAEELINDRARSQKRSHESESEDDLVEIISENKQVTPIESEPVAQDQAPSSNGDDSKQRKENVPNIPIVDYDFSEDEEDALVEQLRQEEQEYNSFRTSLNPHVTNATFLEEELTEQQMKEKRDSDEVTAAMVAEVQSLLSKFGIPYVTAPMEAEAQCAELLTLRLVDGIITDDSDIFLFGGDKVYKNMFHEKNYVEFYQAGVLAKELGLDRDKFIELAQLLGSDYTNGVKGVGPVSAMEILAEFGNLAAFRDWYNEGQFNTKLQKKESTFQKNLRKRLVTNEVILDSDFPSEIVREAYIRPDVDHDTTKFVWGVPDLDMLRVYLHSTIGWPQEKSDEVLIPLIKEINNRKKTGTQKTLTSFFPTEYIKASKDLKLSKRIKNASGKLKKQRTE